MNMHNDERGILVSWLVRVVILVGILGAAVYDTSVLAVNYFRLDGIARDAAVELADRINDRTLRYTDVRGLRRAALEIVRPEGARIVSIEADEEGAVVIELRREAPTVVVRRVGALRDYGRATATARADTP